MVLELFLIYLWYCSLYRRTETKNSLSLKKEIYVRYSKMKSLNTYYFWCLVTGYVTLHINKGPLYGIRSQFWAKADLNLWSKDQTSIGLLLPMWTTYSWLWKQFSRNCNTHNIHKDNVQRPNALTHSQTTTKNHITLSPNTFARR